MSVVLRQANVIGYIARKYPQVFILHVYYFFDFAMLLAMWTC